MRKALIIGINEYPEAPLCGCINDAYSFAGCIETNGDGSPNFDIKKGINVKTKSDLKTMIIELFSGNSDIALLYFSGHGFLDDIGGYLVTPDYQKNDPGVPMNEILDIANNSQSKNRVIFLDCCHAGNFGVSGSQKSTNNTTSIKEGLTILTSSGVYESSLEVNGHGIFTNLLLEALKGGAADLRGNITPGSIYAYIDQSLGAWDQRPVFKTNITQFTPLRKVNPQVHLGTLHQIIKYFPTPTDFYRLDPSYEDTNSPDIQHAIVEPHADPANVSIFKDLQKLESVGLVTPFDEEHMYYAAMNSKSCKLTALGNHYWNLVKNKRI